MERFIPAHPKKIIGEGELFEKLPLVENDPSGVVALIDVSGFTKLTNALQEAYGTDGGAKLLEIINRPFERIGNLVHRHGGSIVKFAGDSALAVWPSQSDNSHCARAVLCCFEILQVFDTKQSHKKQTRHAINTMRSSNSPSDSRKTSVFDSIKRFSVRGSIAPRLSSAGGDMSRKPKSEKALLLESQIGVHIGLGFNSVLHVYLGEDFVGNNERIPRREYIVGGEAVLEAGHLLDKGTRGQAVISTELLESINMFIRDSTKRDDDDDVDGYGQIESILEDSAQDGMIFLEPSNDDVLTMISNIRSIFVNQRSALPYEELAVLPPIQILPFLEESLSAALINLGVNNETSVLDIESWMCNYHQMRRITVVFLRLSSLKIESLNGAENAQKVFKIVLKASRQFGGCIRQVNYDDKALSVLLVWGMEGFSHETAESVYALEASLQMEKELVKKFGRDFQIGVSSDRIYIGLIGNSLRMDGTVLGAAVNKAARLMCLPSPKGASLLCDEATYQECRESIAFDESIPPFNLKGFADPIKTFIPLRNIYNSENSEKADGELFGRDYEMQTIKRAYQQWHDGGKTTRIMITGASGYGKSSLYTYTRKLMLADSEIIRFFTRGDEMHQQTPLYSIGQFLRNIALQLIEKGFNPKDIVHSLSTAGSSAASIQTIDNLPLFNPKKQRSKFIVKKASEQRASLKNGNISHTSSVKQLNRTSLPKIPPATEDNHEELDAFEELPQYNFKSRRTSIALQALTRSSSVASNQSGAYSSNDSLPCIHKRDEVFFFYEGMLDQLQLPKQTIRLFASIPGLFGQTAYTKNEAKIAIRLGAIISKILEGIASTGFKISLAFDGIQRFDNISFQIIRQLLNSCPKALFIFLGRPREEWRDSVVHEYDYLTADTFTVGVDLKALDHNAIQKMVSERLKIDDLDQDLLSTIIEKSQGVPLALGVMLQVLENSLKDKVVSNDALRKALEEQLGSMENANSAVAAQMDKVSPVFRFVVSVASVVGQFFDLITLSEVIKEVIARDRPSFSLICEPYEILSILKKDDLYGFLTVLDESNFSLSFAHFLIHRGVLSKLFPSKRIELHEVILSYLETRISIDERAVLIPIMLRHALEVPGMEAKACDMLYELFNILALENKVAEALQYRSKLLQMDKDYFDRLSLSLQVLDFRMLALLEREKGNISQAAKYCQDALALCGYKLPMFSENPVQFGIECARFALFFHKLRTRTSESVQRCLCLQKLSQSYPHAFSRWKSLGSISKSKISDSAFTDLNDDEYGMLEEIIKVEELLVVMLSTKNADDISALLAAVISFPLYFVSNENSSWRRRTAYKSVGFCLHMSGYFKSANYYFKLSSSVEKEAAGSDQNFYVMLDALYDAQISILRPVYNCQEAIEVFSELYSMMKETGMQFNPYIGRIVQMMECAIRDTGSVYVDKATFEFDSPADDLMSLYIQSFPSNDNILRLKTCEAVRMALECKFEASEKIFLQCMNLGFENFTPPKSETCVLSLIFSSLNLLSAACILYQSAKQDYKTKLIWKCRIELLSRYTVQSFPYVSKIMATSIICLFSSTIDTLCNLFLNSTFHHDFSIINSLRPLIKKLLKGMQHVTIHSRPRTTLSLIQYQWATAAIHLWNGHYSEFSTCSTAFASKYKKCLQEFQHTILEARRWQARVLVEGWSDGLCREGRMLHDRLHPFQHIWELYVVKGFLENV